VAELHRSRKTAWDHEEWDSTLPNQIRSTLLSEALTTCSSLALMVENVVQTTQVSSMCTNTTIDCTR
jgi:hypothetical protein